MRSGLARVGGLSGDGDTSSATPPGWTGRGVSPSCPQARPPFAFFLPFAGGTKTSTSRPGQVPACHPTRAYLPLPTGVARPEVPIAIGGCEASAWGTRARRRCRLTTLGRHPL